MRFIEKLDRRKGHWYGTFICECGRNHIARISHVKFGKVNSCGCLINAKSKTHGMTESLEYKTWSLVKRRCYNENDRMYWRYGARGIVMSRSWANSFENFYRDMGPRPTKSHTLDRIDNSKGYSKSNCRWATMREQQNNRTNNRYFKYKGRAQTVDMWARELGLNRDLIWNRIKLGWSVVDAIETPTLKHGIKYAKLRK